MVTASIRSEESVTWRLIRRRIESTGAIEIQASGISMFPFIRAGDRCRFEKRALGDIRIGDVFLVHVGGRLLGHRLIRIDTRNREVSLVCKGDTNLYPDTPIHWPDVIGVLTLVYSKDRTFPMDGWRARVWTRIILMFPAYSRMFRRIAKRRYRRLTVVES